MQLFPRADQGFSPAGHFFISLQPPREQSRRQQDGFAGEAGFHGSGCLQGSCAGVCCLLAAGTAPVQAGVAWGRGQAVLQDGHSELGHNWLLAAAPPWQFHLIEQLPPCLCSCPFLCSGITESFANPFMCCSGRKKLFRCFFLLSVKVLIIPPNPAY